MTSNTKPTLNPIHSLFASALLLVFLILTVVTGARAAEPAQKRGLVTDLPIPRFVSLKAVAVNFRVGPGRKYAISWQYKKRGLPVEVIQEFDRWRRVRDSQGTTGWVLHSLLSARRTALVAPWDRTSDANGKVIDAAMHEGKYRANKDSSTSAKMQAGLLVDIQECDAGWCRIEAFKSSAWMQQEKLWGTYPGEKVDG